LPEEYEDELVTSHSDEDPELNQNTERKPMILPSTEGSAVSELYAKDKDRIKKGWLGVTEEEAGHITEYQDSEGNYWVKE
jgi:hypothetical protein